jgi:hypothetical protein
MASIGEHVGDLGKDAFVIADENVWGWSGARSRARSGTPRST